MRFYTSPLSNPHARAMREAALTDRALSWIVWGGYILLWVAIVGGVAWLYWS